MKSKKARFKSGLLDFEYCASLHILRAQLNPDVVSQALDMQPTRAHRAGDARQTPSGKGLRGNYDKGYWTVDLEPRDGEDIAEFMSRLADELAKSKSLLQNIVAEGGDIECFIGVFANALCDQVFPAELLGKLSRLGIDLRLDNYGHSKEVDSPSDGK